MRRRPGDDVCRLDVIARVLAFLADLFEWGFLRGVLMAHDSAP